MTAWFGEPWPDDWRENGPAPVCENPAQRVPTPVGAICLHCTEPVAEGDRGILMPAVDMGPDGKPQMTILPAHAECQLRMGAGGPAHWLGNCTCSGGHCDPDLGMPPREAARWVWDRLYQISRKELS